MIAGESLVILAQVLLLLLTAWKLIELARRRDRARLDVALLLGTLAVAVGVDLLERSTGADLGSLRRAAPVAAVAHPLLLLRLVDHFRPVPRWVVGTALGAVLVSWALLLAADSHGVAATVVVALLFAAGTLYATRALLLGARHGQGVSRRRMRLVGAGAVLVALLALIHGAGLLSPALGARLATATQVGALGAAICYGLGLAPPPWLSRAWQQEEVLQFLRAAAGQAGEETETALTRLCRTARHAVGGQAAALARWNEGRGRLELELRGERALVGGPLPADGLIGRHWTFRRPFVAASRTQVRQACQRVAPGLDCGAILGVPLITPARVWGLLLVFVRRGPLAPEEELRLLSLLAQHTAVFLDYAALVEQLRRENAALRGEPVQDEPPLDES